MNKYGQFPPALLSAGGTAYLIVDLSTEAELAQEDARSKAAPASTAGPRIAPTLCEPEPVRSIELTIGGAAVAVPTPAAFHAAACRRSTFVFGVGPVVAHRPVAG